MSDDWTHDPDPAEDWDAHRVLETGEWEEYREPMSRWKRVVIVLGVLIGVVVLAAGGAWMWVQRQIDPPGAPGDDVELEVAVGSTTKDIGQLLDDKGVISSARIWNYWTRLNDEGPFQAGIYVFQENSSFREAVDVLDAGPEPPESDRVTIPEGLTVSEILPRLVDPETGLDRWSLDELQLAVDSGSIRSAFQPDDVASLEGLLFPDTYEVAEETGEATFIRQLVDEMDRHLRRVDVEQRALALGRTPYEIVIIASLIEEEAKVPEERAKISRVIHNRLAQGIPLGIDATSRYEAELAGRDRGQLDFESDSPYNTRRQAGLPPTPIAAPGQASIEAALAPADGPWIYYVLADAEGHHVFTDSAREFQQAKQECIQKDLGCG